MALIDSPEKSGASSICASLFPSLRAWQETKQEQISLFNYLAKEFWCSVLSLIRLQKRAKYMPPLKRQFQSSASQDIMLRILANCYNMFTFHS
jgi:hypothetical protein